MPGSTRTAKVPLLMFSLAMDLTSSFTSSGHYFPLPRGRRLEASDRKPTPEPTPRTQVNAVCFQHFLTARISIWRARFMARVQITVVFRKIGGLMAQSHACMNPRISIFHLQRHAPTPQIHPCCLPFPVNFMCHEYTISLLVPTPSAGVYYAKNRSAPFRLDCSRAVMAADSEKATYPLQFQVCWVYNTLCP